MSELERSHNVERPAGSASGPPVGTDAAALEATQHTASAYLAAAQAAINQALSGNSLAFNNALRQRGGQ